MAGQPRLSARPRGPVPPPDRDPLMDIYVAWVMAICLAAAVAVIVEVFRL